MTVDRRSLGLPAFSEPVTDSSVPAQSAARRPAPLEQGADFREPPGEEEPAPSPVRRAVGLGGLTFSDPDRQI
ncbi:hypothetical protein OG500_36825 [Kitasatospora sp. NBC_01250]|uniref:hypothetical protein n=1 Tax=unclassified Kitasatospora TaxID=2633591 RepID=UPI002E0DE2ED|nr:MULTISPECIES: hypothetical protein [unclassified Kitasatospora]WSJ71526.1 hypothetical protein OG294_38515 [Kitasatospora sp. NBC_01302]